MALEGIAGRSSIDYMLRDIYQIGQVLRKKKYFYLGLSYRIFLAGVVLSIVTFAVEIIALNRL